MRGSESDRETHRHRNSETEREKEREREREREREDFISRHGMNALVCMSSCICKCVCRHCRFVCACIYVYVCKHEQTHLLYEIVLQLQPFPIFNIQLCRKLLSISYRDHITTGKVKARI